PADVDKYMRAAEDAVRNEEWERARTEAQRALALIEKEGHIPLGDQEVWERARLLAASAWVLDQDVKPNKRSAANVSQGHKDQARKLVEPILAVKPDYRITADEDPIFRDVYMEIFDEIRRTGTITVMSTARNAPVYVNGVKVGTTPLEGYRLGLGTWEVQVGQPDAPSRIHLAEIEAGKDVALEIDPNFEFGLTTQGYAIVEAPPGQAAEVSAVQVGSGTARLTGSRYSLVFAVEGAKPLLLYAAMVDGEN